MSISDDGNNESFRDVENPFHVDTTIVRTPLRIARSENIE
jgi:hypothetical protein